jgi:hypothetical protein
VQGVKAGFFGAPKPKNVSSAVASIPPTTSDLPKPSNPPDPEPSSAPEPQPKPSEPVEDEGPADDEGQGMAPNDGNGLNLDKYSWTQTLSEVLVSVPVPSGTRGKDCDVSISSKAMRVGLKGGEAPVLKGNLHKPVVEDECFWNCDGACIEITLQKKEGMNWWDTIIEGEPVINTKKVQPENSKLEDLDGETRQTVEKMMYDQRQKAAGKPTSDQQKQQEMLQKFMAAHPEMDFSNAKMM